MPKEPDDASVDVRRFFERKAVGYDENWRGAYGRLVDALLWEAFEFSVFSRLPEGFTFLDLGGGAGRWTHRIATSFLGSTGMLYDLTPGLVDQAAQRARRSAYADRVRFRLGDVRDAAELLSGASFDLILNSHHLLGFVDDPKAVLSSLTRLLSVDGLMVSFLPSRWHAAFEGLGLEDAEQTERSLAGMQWAANPAPYRHLFTPGEIRVMHTAAHLSVDLLSGFPSLMHPGVHETARDRAEQVLQDEGVFQRVLAMEKELFIDPDSRGRGANLFVVASRATPRIP
ncbi:class I SAM-dependent methyltransferase [Streptomyces sp. 110]|uniref:Class I SAM-dependent methyltransferase n=1 Tax=Streptomyces endocoffeicus TaxID=2898945 RepID=A0ABS1PS63_9ACTN|nr:methyltransferase domain-containing protein [Streptomyces endocoffeicus]MBL1114975.1 class I SAM-dependent methyltransferase [Streptomyces endocoffeicus]